MPLNLDGKAVLVTGASGGIGQLIAVNLAASKAHVLLVGRDEASLSAVKETISRSGGRSDILVADLLEPADRARITEYCSALPDGLFGLINNAGCNHFALLPDQSDQMLQNQINLNLTAPVLLTRALLPLLSQQQGARIMNIGSTFGSIGYPGYTAYCASKFGLRGFTEALRRELADADISIMYFAPRATATRLNPENVVAMNKALGNAMDAPALVAEQICKVFVAGSPHQLYWGWPEKLFARINQLLPSIVDGALRKQLATIKQFSRT